MKNENNEIQPAKTRLLFVDDEEGVRVTLSAILRQEGFDVAVASTVPEALEIINHQEFDVLLTDLNIGSPADGFILVSAMRKLQPRAATFILTGYPDFQTALEAIGKQVDNYFTKPADIPTLVSAIRDKARNPRQWSETPSKRCSAIILENSDEIIQRWLTQIGTDSRLAAIRISKDDRIDRLPFLLNDLANALEARAAQITAKSTSAAAVHGADRAKQGYTLPLLVAETRILNKVIAEVMQENLLIMNLSTLIPEALKIGEYLQAILEESIRTFEATKIAPARQTKAKAS